MSGVLFTLFEVLSVALNIFQWVVIIMIIMSWLIQFNVINLHNQFVAMIWDAVNRLTEPVLGPIRRVLPSFGGIDLSPVVLFLGIMFLQGIIGRSILPAIAGM